MGDLQLLVQKWGVGDVELFITGSHFLAPSRWGFIKT